MSKEIERKFLIDLNGINNLGEGSVIKQGYISTSRNAVVRVRLLGQKAFLTLKGANSGIVRSEFEYPIPVSDAKQIISELCTGPVIEKTRYLVKYSNHIWEIDVFDGDNAGLIVAEIELGSELEEFDLPSWVSKEVSGEVQYYNSSLINNPFKNW